jgi:hypothetical protein
MGPLRDSFALSCRACGAPRALRQERCGHCGSTEQPDGATLARLRVHRARVRRALQQLRAVVTSQVAGELMHRQLYWLVGLYFGLPIAGLLLGLAVLALSLAIVGAQGPPAVVGALAAGALGSLGGWGGIVLAYRAVKRLAQRARARAREIVLGIEGTTPVLCPQCGGHAAVVALQPEEPYPCPWCNAALLPSGAADAQAAVLIRALLAHHEDLAERFTRAELARRRRRPAVRPPPLPGFELTGGGTVARGATGGVPLRAFNDLVGGQFVLRLEAPVETGRAGEAWFVRPAVEKPLRELTREWGYDLPQAPVAGAAEGWRAYAEPGVAAPEVPALAATLSRLGPADALLLDPAGLSLWRRASGLSAAWGLLVEHHATVAALASALAPAGAPGPAPAASLAGAVRREGGEGGDASR